RMSIRRGWAGVPLSGANGAFMFNNAIHFADVNAGSAGRIPGPPKHYRKRLLSKSEARNPKPERNPNSETRTGECPKPASGFRISAFGILSDLGFRRSDLFHSSEIRGTLEQPWVLRHPASLILLPIRDSPTCFRVFEDHRCP